MDSTYDPTARPTSARLTGAMAGLAVGALFALEDVLEAGTGSAPLSTTSLTYVVAKVGAGGLGGWLFGPAAMRATTGRSWVGVVLGLAVVAVIVGAITATLPFAAHLASELGLDPLTWLTRASTYWLGFATLGILILGLPALLLTIVPAGIWAATMAWLAGRQRL